MEIVLDPPNEMLPPPSSPTNSSISSSDLDTESTGSFFHDRSTTLGTLMGVTFPAITFGAPSQHRDPQLAAATASATNPNNTKKKKKILSAAVERRWRRRRRWWALCRDEEAKPASLGEFLEVERRFGDEALAAELEGMVAAATGTAGRSGNEVNGRVLFADGRVLPPAADVDDGTPAAAAGALCRFPVSFTGICSGGVG